MLFIQMKDFYQQSQYIIDLVYSLSSLVFMSKFMRNFMSIGSFCKIFVNLCNTILHVQQDLQFAYCQGKSPESHKTITRDKLFLMLFHIQLKPLLKIGTANAIYVNYLGLFYLETTA